MTATTTMMMKMMLQKTEVLDDDVNVNKQAETIPGVDQEIPGVDGTEGEIPGVVDAKGTPGMDDATTGVDDEATPGVDTPGVGCPRHRKQVR